MSRLLLPVALIAIFAGVGTGWQLLASTPSGGNPAPSFTARTFDGKVTRLSDLKGRPVVLDFWATWCRPCRASMPHLSTMQERYRSRGLVVIGLAVDDGDPGRVRTFVDKLGVQFKVAMADEHVLDDYGPIRSIPTTFFIDRRGQVVRRLVGYIDEETLDGYVQEIVANADKK